MKVAFLGNSFHLKTTKSSDFFVDFLRNVFADVRVIPFSEAWVEVPRERWDILVVWQTLREPEELEAFRVPRVVLVPMTDACPRTAEFWVRYKRFKVIIFSTSFVSHLRQLGLDCFGAQYFPPAMDPIPNPQDFGLRGFFWPRTPQLGWSTVKKLIGETRFDSFHIHWARDLNPELADFPGRDDVARHSIRTSSWFVSQAQYLDCVRQANVFFASRRAEGIGMSFLEAMAAGMCVVAPDAPTMNEYIQNGRNGLLYDPDKPQPLDFSRHRELARAAYDTCRDGRRRWEAAVTELKDFMTDWPELLPSRPHHFIRLERRTYVGLRSLYRIAKKILPRK